MALERLFGNNEIIASPVSNGAFKLSLSEDVRQKLSLSARIATLEALLNQEIAARKAEVSDLKKSVTAISAKVSLSQIKQYDTDPNTESIAPGNISQPAFAYQKDGTGPSMSWNTTTNAWQ